MQLIDGQAIARTIRAEVARDVAALVAAGHRPPGLAAVLVGEDPASKVYVGSKGRACRAAGLHSVTLTLPASTSQAELMEHVRALNQDPAIDGILVQLPLPAGLDEQAIIESIDPAKDVDGFHPANVGRVQIGLEDAFAPATPAGVLELLRRSELPTAGRHLVVLGRSNIVGKPLMALMVQKGVDCTVTVCHSRSRDLAEHCRRADILVAAIGRPGAITAGMVKPGAVVIDVGINRVDDASAPKGYRIVGDVDFESVAPLCSAITPVPGGVGPMTIAMLLSNTLRSARRRLGITAK
ncbi:MAG: bifunctional methylenetetrahydrofolate dehydrogenase/methenyltetrahydrofolate cyclohydrolase FolD [Candidatus Delongbacteria bacterium]|nr:bifunctional methylenetetrahydrofolate dehydrogenase/methenyltetrahydrofolate cyclohydrolase FolD [Candidatus Cloacimonadota bacterium]MCB9474055.1 bifunctional methylenetetrahydrofolate dehydrogenase/methenyltetrahydrofolate cyclohydrolase FolD [Candidatus Delongbacteria bacterium]